MRLYMPARVNVLQSLPQQDIQRLAPEHLHTPYRSSTTTNALTHLVVIFYESSITSEKKRLQLYGHNRFILMTIRDFIQRAPALPK